MSIPIIVNKQRCRARSRMTLKWTKRKHNAYFTTFKLQYKHDNAHILGSKNTFYEIKTLLIKKKLYLAISGRVLLIHFSVFFMREEFCKRKNGRINLLTLKLCGSHDKVTSQR